VEEIVEGIRHGVRKVNIDTDLRMAFVGAVRQFLMQPENSKDIDFRKFMLAATRSMKEICRARFEAFGSAGHAAAIKPLGCDKMAERYRSGELSAVVT
jgi:fructose-bisphosphate aldolase class II